MKNGKIDQEVYVLEYHFQVDDPVRCLLEHNVKHNAHADLDGFVCIDCVRYWWVDRQEGPQYIDLPLEDAPDEEVEEKQASES